MDVLPSTGPNWCYETFRVLCRTKSWSFGQSQATPLWLFGQDIQVHMDDPNYSSEPDFESDWSKTIDGELESKPDYDPKPLEMFVTPTHYVDANQVHGVLSAKFVAARGCVKQIIDLQIMLRYLGVPIRDKSYMFGDNKSVVDSSMQVHAKLHKQHTILSFHRVRECVASKMVGFYFIPGDSNPADILSKHWGYSQVWTRLKALLFWMGDTNDIHD